MGANIAEAQGANSKKDFAKFYDISLKSGHETIYWLMLFKDALEIKLAEIDILIDEASSLTRMIAASLLTMRNKRWTWALTLKLWFCALSFALWVTFMVFKVPQFIEVEDKIFGPLTFKQFLYIAGGAGACFVLWNFLPFFIAFLLIIPMAGLSLALAFYKVNNRPFVVLLESFLAYHMGSKLYLWQKRAPTKKVATGLVAPRQHTAGTMPRLTGSRLRDMAWSLDVNQNISN